MRHIFTKNGLVWAVAMILPSGVWGQASLDYGRRIETLVPSALPVYSIVKDAPEVGAARLAGLLLSAEEQIQLHYRDTPITLIGRSGRITLEVYKGNGAWRWGDYVRKYAGSPGELSLSQEELRRVADQFLGSRSNLISLLPEERMEFDSVHYVKEQSIDETTGVKNTRTNSAIVLYRRLLSGVPVVNSNLAVFVDGERNVVAVDALWPRVERAALASRRSSAALATDLTSLAASSELTDLRIGFEIEGWVSEQTRLEPKLFVVTSTEVESAEGRRTQRTLRAVPLVDTTAR